ncbi:MAG: hypothetical protein WCF84_04760 [Anaerolineae bacterium]
MSQVFGLIKKHSTLVELCILAVATLFYGAAFLDFNPAHRPPGVEYLNAVSLGQVALQAFHAGQFPLWNPFWYSGIPYAADPFFYLVNPFVSIPVLTLGGITGPKIAYLIHFFLTAFGGWLLAYSLGLRAVVRIWAGVLLLASGKLAAVINNGTSEYVWSFPWMAIFLALLFLLIRRRKKRFIVLAALAWAFLFLGGFLYYFLFSIPCFLIIAAASLFDFDREKLRFAVDWPLARALGLVALFAFGLLMIRFLPVGELYPALEKGGNAYDPDLNCSQSVNWTLTNFIIPEGDFYSRNIPPQMGPPQEYYAYIGLTPFVALLFIIPAFRPGKRRWILTLGAVLFFTVLYATPKYNFLALVYDLAPTLKSLSCPVRIYALETVVLVALAGLAVDYILDAMTHLAVRLAASIGSSSNPSALVRTSFSLSNLGYALVVLLLALSVKDVMSANRVERLADYPTRDRLAAEWLRQYDSTTFSVMARDSFSFIELYDERIPLLNPTFLWRLRQNPETSADLGQGLRAGPNYFIGTLTSDSPITGALIKTLSSGDSVYKVDDALPFAFVVPRATLEEPLPSGDNVYFPTHASEVAGLRPAEARIEGTNRIVLSANGIDASDMVVLLTSYYPGWELAVDGHPTKIERVSWYMGIPALSGAHTYVFEFHSHPFEIGATIAFLTLLAMGGYLLVGWRRTVGLTKVWNRGPMSSKASI